MENAKSYFGELNVGDLFSDNVGIFIKIDNIYSDNEDEGGVNAILVRGFIASNKVEYQAGGFWEFTDDELITPCNSFAPVEEVVATKAPISDMDKLLNNLSAMKGTFFTRISDNKNSVWIHRVDGLYNVSNFDLNGNFLEALNAVEDLKS